MEIPEEDFRKYEQVINEISDQNVLFRKKEELWRIICVSLLTRCGGDVTILKDEIDHNQKNYELIEQIIMDGINSQIRVKLRYNPKDK